MASIHDRVARLECLVLGAGLDKSDIIYIWFEACLRAVGKRATITTDSSGRTVYSVDGKEIVFEQNSRGGKSLTILRKNKRNDSYGVSSEEALQNIVTMLFANEGYDSFGVLWKDVVAYLNAHEIEVQIIDNKMLSRAFFLKESGYTVHVLWVSSPAKMGKITVTKQYGEQLSVTNVKSKADVERALGCLWWLPKYTI